MSCILHFRIHAIIFVLLLQLVTPRIADLHVIDMNLSVLFTDLLFSPRLWDGPCSQPCAQSARKTPIIHTGCVFESGTDLCLWGLFL